MITNKGCKRLRDLEKKVAAGGGLLEEVNAYDIGDTFLSAQEVTNNKVLTLEGNYPSEYGNIGCVVIYDGVEYVFDSADYPIGDNKFVNAPFVIEKRAMEDESGASHIYYEFGCNDENTHTIEAYYTIQKETLNKTAKQIIDLIDNGVMPSVAKRVYNADDSTSEIRFVNCNCIMFLDNNKTKGVVEFDGGVLYGFDSLSDYPTMGYVPSSVTDPGIVDNPGIVC